MPVVPKYQSGVQERGFPTDRVSAEAPLSAFGVGDAVNNAYAQTENLVNTVQNRMDQTALIEADNQLTVARNEIMNQVRQQKRQAAAGSPEIAQKSYSEAVDKIRGNLNGKQQQAFDRLSSAGWKQTYEDVNKHMLAEGQAWKKETNAAGIQINQNDAINNYLDETGRVNYKKVDESLMKQRVIRDIEQGDEGYGDDVKSLRNLKDSTETHTAIIQNMLASGLDLKAKEYYTRYENQIDKEAAKSVVAALESGSTRVAAVDLADTLIASGTSEKAAMAAIQKQYEIDKNVDKRFLAESRVKSHFNDIEQAKDRSQSDMRTAASNILDSNNYDLTDPKVASLLRNMNDSGKLAIRAYANSRGSKSDNLETLNSAETDLYDTDKVFKESEILDMDISPSSKKELVDWNREKANNTEKWQKRQGDYSTVSKIVKTKADQVGIKSKKERAFFEESLKKQIKVEEQLRGKPLNTEEKEKLANDLTMKQALSWRLDPRKFMVTYEDIPASDVTEIKASLVGAGLPVNQDTILRFFLQGKDE